MQTEHDSGPRTKPAPRRWPLWLAGAAATGAALFMIVALMGWRSAEHDADEAETQVATANDEAAELVQERRQANGQVDEADTEVEMLEGLLRPGTAEALNGVYLGIIQVGCAHQGRDIETVVADAAGDVAADSPLAAHPGWEQAIDREAVGEALESCEASDE